MCFNQVLTAAVQWDDDFQMCEGARAYSKKTLKELSLACENYSFLYFLLQKYFFNLTF